MSNHPEASEAPHQIDPDLAAMLFDETGQASAEGENADENAAGDAGAPKKRGLLGRLKSLFSRKKKTAASEEEAPEEAAPSAGEAAEENADETAPPRHHLILKKLLIVALPILLVLGLIGGGVFYAFKRMEAAKEAEVARQIAEIKAKQAELEKQKAELEALKRQAAKQAEDAKKAAEAAKQEGQPAAPASKQAAQDGGPLDCTVTKNGEDATQALKRCIDAYNRATGR